jgi:2-dehydro-3-deoxyphosphogluconate aldolase / (4S)-4-hydroxy-2-oxoglutarate aldolase
MSSSTGTPPAEAVADLARPRGQEGGVARFSRLQVYTAMLDVGVVPLFHHDDPDVAVEVVRAVAAGGCRVVEFTNRGAFAHDVFAALERACRRELPDVVLGAGSVVDGGTAALYLNLGAAFIVGPALNADVARVCNRRKVAYLPGCATATEVGQAEELGCEIVKLFPGDVAGGPAFVKALRGPSPWTSVMPTGGVEPTPASLGAWFDAGAVCVGIGGRLITSALVEARDWDGLTTQARAAVEVAARQRPGA